MLLGEQEDLSADRLAEGRACDSEAAEHDSVLARREQILALPGTLQRVHKQLLQRHPRNYELADPNLHSNPNPAGSLS